MKFRDGKKIQKEIRKVVMFKTAKTIILCNGVWICMLFMVWLFIYALSNGVHNNDVNRAYAISLLIFIAVIDIFLSKISSLTYNSETRNMIARHYVDLVLSEDAYVEVLPSEIPTRYRTFIKNYLPQYADFFAILNDERIGVSIFLKFKKHNSYVFLEYVEKKKFPTTYIIKNSCDDVELKLDEVKKMLNNSLSPISQKMFTKIFH